MVDIELLKHEIIDNAFLTHMVAFHCHQSIENHGKRY